ncbi:MAG: hypothetical protein CM15mP93_06320 [Thiotrichaceae bacterium]|nr:MAG: hypothetical protein CM15mP93_06320 [Thiotrichaceae bacterium]
MCEVRKKVYAKNGISDCYPAFNCSEYKKHQLSYLFYCNSQKIIEVKNVNQTAPYKYPSGYVSTHPLFSRAIIIDKEEKFLFQVQRVLKVMKQSTMEILSSNMSRYVKISNLSLKIMILRKKT